MPVRPSLEAPHLAPAPARPPRPKDFRDPRSSARGAARRPPARGDSSRRPGTRLMRQKALRRRSRPRGRGVEMTDEEKVAAMFVIDRDVSKRAAELKAKADARAATKAAEAAASSTTDAKVKTAVAVNAQTGGNLAEAVQKALDAAPVPLDPMQKAFATARQKSGREVTVSRLPGGAVLVSGVETQGKQFVRDALTIEVLPK